MKIHHFLVKMYTFCDRQQNTEVHFMVFAGKNQLTAEFVHQNQFKLLNLEKADKRAYKFHKNIATKFGSLSQ